MLYAVSHISFHDNELTTVIVEAPTERAALDMHEKIHELFPGTEVEADEEEAEEGEMEVEPELEVEGDLFDEEAYPDMDSLKQAAFNADAIINVVAIEGHGSGDKDYMRAY
jgi:hypothetical protein